MMNILITGTSKGLGAGLAEYYLKRNHHVFGISRNENPDLNMSNFRFLPQDLSDSEALKSNLPTFLNGQTRLELVIFNAGVLNGIKDLSETSIDEIQKCMNINVWANKVMIDSLFNHMDRIEQVVAISSGASKNGSRGWNAYALSKATLNMLINLYSKEYTNTHFSAIAPGLVDTGMQDYIYELPDDERFPVVQKLKQAKGTQSMPEPEIAAELVANSIKKAVEFESGIFIDIRD